jgi:hypothetical protein
MHYRRPELAYTLSVVAAFYHRQRLAVSLSFILYSMVKWEQVQVQHEKFFIERRKIDKIRKIAGQLLTESRHARRWVLVKRMRTFIGTCVSLTLAMPYAQFYTRSLYWDLATVQHPTGSNSKLLEGCVASWEGPGKDGTLPRAARGGDRCKLRYQGIHDIQSWRALTITEREGRPLRHEAPELMMQTDAADLGYD